MWLSEARPVPTRKSASRASRTMNCLPHSGDSLADYQDAGAPIWQLSAWRSSPWEEGPSQLEEQRKKPWASPSTPVPPIEQYKSKKGAGRRRGAAALRQSGSTDGQPLGNPEAPRGVGSCEACLRQTPKRSPPRGLPNNTPEYHAGISRRNNTPE